MKIREAAISRKSLFKIAAISAFFLGWIVFWLVGASLDSRSPLGPYLHDNIIGNLVGAVVVALATGLITLSFRNGVVLRRLVFSDDRKTFRTAHLGQHFAASPSMTPTGDGGWRAEGEGHVPESVALYNEAFQQPFSISAQFKPVRKDILNNYWRAGLTLYRTNGGEAVTVHLDNHHLLVGYIGGLLCLCVPLSIALENKWFLLELDLSYTPQNPQTQVSRIFCHLNGKSWFVGTIPNADLPLRPAVRAWSDENQRHLVQVRDVAIARRIA